jgi:hypothetical protein
VGEHQVVVSREARDRFKELHAVDLARRAAKTRSARLRNLQNEVVRLDIDGRRELRAIDAQLELLAGRVARRRAA